MTCGWSVRRNGLLMRCSPTAEPQILCIQQLLAGSTVQNQRINEYQSSPWRGPLLIAEREESGLGILDLEHSARTQTPRDTSIMHTQLHIVPEHCIAKIV